MRDEREYPPQFVKYQVSEHTHHILAISIWNDERARVLADSLGAYVLLDKTKLVAELIPAIRECCLSISNTSMPLPKGFKQMPEPSMKPRNDAA